MKANGPHRQMPVEKKQRSADLQQIWLRMKNQRFTQIYIKISGSSKLSFYLTILK